MIFRKNDAKKCVKNFRFPLCATAHRRRRGHDSSRRLTAAETPMWAASGPAPRGGCLSGADVVYWAYLRVKES